MLEECWFTKVASAGAKSASQSGYYQSCEMKGLNCALFIQLAYKTRNVLQYVTSTKNLLGQTRLVNCYLFLMKCFQRALWPDWLPIKGVSKKCVYSKLGGSLTVTGTLIKLRFSKKATKIWRHLPVDFELLKGHPR